MRKLMVMLLTGKALEMNSKGHNKHGTDWDRYYSNPSSFTNLTRAVTRRFLREALKRNLPNRAPSIIELGGGDSSFFDDLSLNFSPSGYTVIDLNETGLKKFRDRTASFPSVKTVSDDVLNLRFSGSADIVFSVGLIEHFTDSSFREAVKSHFQLARQGGIVVLIFPLQSFVYRFSRKAMEAAGKWMFHDEHPLRFEDVLSITPSLGELRERRTIWPLFLTQGMLVFQKNTPFRA